MNNNTKVIYNRVFLNFANLSSFVFSDNITSIGFASFDHCTSLSSIHLPDGLLRIDNFAFNGCSSLADINIPNSIEYVGTAAFQGCHLNLNECESSKYLGNGTNPYLVLMSSVFSTIHEGCKILYGPNSMITPSTITSLVIPDSVVQVQRGGLYGCASLQTIVFSNNIIEIVGGTFKDCPLLQNVVIPDSVKKVSLDMFYYCQNLDYVVVPKTIEQIGGFGSGWNYHLNTSAKLLYKGNKNDWDMIPFISNDNDALSNLTIYYYSDDEPSSGGNYWHFVNDIPTVW